MKRPESGNNNFNHLNFPQLFFCRTKQKRNAQWLIGILLHTAKAYNDKKEKRKKQIKLKRKIDRKRVRKRKDRRRRQRERK
jgi:hypothetical protein